MIYALLKAVHLLSVVVWIGGMFFTLYCLRPALSKIDGPLRVRLMRDVLARFFAAVSVAAALVLATGVAMMFSAAQGVTGAGLAFNMPLDWSVMAALGVLMILVFAHVRLVVFGRLQRAVDGHDLPAAAKALARIRSLVIANLVLGVVVIVVTRLGTVS